MHWCVAVYVECVLCIARAGFRAPASWCGPRSHAFDVEMAAPSGPAR
jgi:hypothetical protein